jgi:hypothetical protein
LILNSAAELNITICDIRLRVVIFDLIFIALAHTAATACFAARFDAPFADFKSIKPAQSWQDCAQRDI